MKTKIDLAIIILIGIFVLLVPEFSIKGEKVNFGVFRYILGSFMILYPIYLLIRYNKKEK